MRPGQNQKFLPSPADAGHCRLAIDMDYVQRVLLDLVAIPRPSALEAGANTRAALIGFGIDGSHGNERTHLDGIRSTAELVALYLQTDLTFRSWDRTPTGELRDFPSTAVQPADEQGPR